MNARLFCYASKVSNACATILFSDVAGVVSSTSFFPIIAFFNSFCSSPKSSSTSITLNTSSKLVKPLITLIKPSSKRLVVLPLLYIRFLIFSFGESFTIASLIS